MHKLLAKAGIFGLIALSGPALGDAAQSLPMCTGCHGADGVSGGPPDAPIIAGIPAVLQEDYLFAYRDGGRECWPPGVMCQISASLSDDDIVELAAHFAEMPYKPAGEDFDAALAAEGEEIHKKDCGMCHGMDDPGDAVHKEVQGRAEVRLQGGLPLARSTELAGDYRFRRHRQLDAGSGAGSRIPGLVNKAGEVPPIARHRHARVEPV